MHPFHYEIHCSMMGWIALQFIKANPTKTHPFRGYTQKNLYDQNYPLVKSKETPPNPMYIQKQQMLQHQQVLPSQSMARSPCKVQPNPPFAWSVEVHHTCFCKHESPLELHISDVSATLQSASQKQPPILFYFFWKATTNFIILCRSLYLKILVSKLNFF